MEFMRSGAIQELLEFYLRNNDTYQLIAIEEGDSLNINGSWTGALGKLQRKEADISLLVSPIDYQQLDVVDFIPYSFVNELVILTPLSSKKSVGDLLKNIIGADLQVFIMIILGVLFCHVVAKMITHVLEPLWHVKKRFDFSMWIAFHVYMGTIHIPSYTSFRILMVFDLLYTMILTFVIYSFIKSDIVVSQNEVITSIADQLKSSTFSLRVIHSGGMLNVLKASLNENYKELADKLENNYGEIFNLANEYHLVRLASNYNFLPNQVIIIEPVLTGVVEELICQAFPDQKYLRSKELFSGILYGLQCARSTTFDKKLYENRVTTSLEAGFSSHLHRLFSRTSPSCIMEMLDYEHQDPEELPIDAFRRTFQLWLIGLMVATLCFLLEIIYFKAFKSNRCKVFWNGKFEFKMLSK